MDNYIILWTVVRKSEVGIVFRNITDIFCLSNKKIPFKFLSSASFIP